MSINPKVKKNSLKKPALSTTYNALRQLAFENSLQAYIITTAATGDIIISNLAARKLLGYSKKELLSRNRVDIFDISESSFKMMLKERKADGHTIASVTAIKKGGKIIPCEITSVVFEDENGVEKAIFTIMDNSKNILRQKNIDIIKQNIVANNVALALSKQKNIDDKNDKIVADNIAIAISKQKKADIKKDKAVADNIAVALLKQKKVDKKNDKVVAANIVLAQKKSDTKLKKNNEWIKYIAQTSYDVMWDWNISTGKIYVGDSIKEVFGYEVKNNTADFTDFSHCLLEEKRDGIQKKIFKAFASGEKKWNDSFLFKRQDGSMASIIGRASIIRDEKGKAIQMIGNIQDVSRLKELEDKLAKETTIKKESDKIFQLAAKLSYDGIWDLNLVTNEFFLGEGFKEIFGYDLNNAENTNFEWGNFIHPEDKEAVLNEMQAIILSDNTYWERAYRFIKANGDIANVFGRVSIIRDNAGKACRMIGVVHDLSQQTVLEDKLKQAVTVRDKMRTRYQENFKLMFNSSSDVLFEINLTTNKLIISDAYEKEFGYRITKNMVPADVWPLHLHPDDQAAVLDDYQRMLASKETQWKCSYRFIRADDSIANVTSSRIILRNDDGVAYRMIGSMQDISKQKRLEERLENEIQLRENQIEEAIDEAKETERSDLGKELHDNVNQLLGASKLYLDMAKLGGQDSKLYLSRSSEYTLTAIEEIRKLSKGLTSDSIKDLGLCNAIKNIAIETMEIKPVKITYELEHFTEENINDKFKLNVYRVVQEQLNNILKHAKATEIDIALSQNKNFVILVITDNGIGFDINKKQKGIGVANIKSRASSFEGIADFVSQPDAGCILTVKFPITELVLK